MVEKDISEKIEQLASETVIKISTMAQQQLQQCVKPTLQSHDLMQVRMKESRKLAKYYFKLYQTFLGE